MGFASAAMGLRVGVFSLALIGFGQTAMAEAAGDQDLDPAILALVGDPEYGAFLSGECSGCHQVSGANDGIPDITQWPAQDFVLAMHSYKNNARIHPVMQMLAGRLSNEEIAALAAYFENLGE